MIYDTISDILLYKGEWKVEEAISNKIVDRKRDNSITMIRVVSMYLIILTHFIRDRRNCIYCSGYECSNI